MALASCIRVSMGSWAFMSLTSLVLACNREACATDGKRREAAPGAVAWVAIGDRPGQKRVWLWERQDVSKWDAKKEAECTSPKNLQQGACMPLAGKLVWVRDPALADDEVFVKCKCISEDEKQVRLVSTHTAAGPRQCTCRCLVFFCYPSRCKL